MTPLDSDEIASKEPSSQSITIMNESISNLDEYETTELLNDTLVFSNKEILYDSLQQLEDLIDDMEDGEEQSPEIWQDFESLLTGNDALAMDRKEFYLSKEQQRGPLMQLFRKKPPVHIVDLILNAWPEDVQVSKVTDENCRTILFHAIQGGASVKVIDRIVEKDADVIMPQTDNRSYPLTEACVQASKQEVFDANSKKTIRYLMKKGREKEYGISPLVLTIGNKEISDSIIEFMLAVSDREFKNEMLTARSPATNLTPLQIALLNDQRSDRLIARLLESERSLSFDVLDNLLARGRSGSRSLQSLVNRKMTERWPVAVLLFELYLRAALVFAFVHASDSFFENNQHRAGRVAIYFFESYFILKEIFELRFRGASYILDFWNVFDIACIVLVLVSTAGMHHDTGDGRDAPDWLKRTIMVTGGFVVWSLILYLRAAFLPFAIFVGGFIRIIYTLGPFLVVSALMVFGFSFMYFVRRIDETCCISPEEDDCNNCSLEESVLETLNYFYSGPERTGVDWLDQFFGVIAVVILLNVVIAIVSDAWEDNKATAGAQFWGYRISFLADVNSILWIRNCLAPLLGLPLSEVSEGSPSNINIWISGENFWDDRDSVPPYQLSELKTGRFNLFGAIDDVGRWSVFDSTPWVEPPYETRIHDANDYYRYTLGFVKYNKQTAEWLSKEDYKKLICCGSFERNWYWASQPSHKEDRVKYPYIKSRPWIAFEFAIYLLLIPLGLVTFGLFWPRHVREFLFGVCSAGNVEADDMSEEITKAIKEESRKRASATLAKRASGMSDRSGNKSRSHGYSAGKSITVSRSPKKTPVKVTNNTTRKARNKEDDSGPISSNDTNTLQKRMGAMESKISSLERKLDMTAQKLEAKLDLMLKIVGETNLPRMSTATAGLYFGMMAAGEGGGSINEGGGAEETSISGRSSETELES